MVEFMDGLLRAEQNRGLLTPRVELEIAKIKGEQALLIAGLPAATSLEVLKGGQVLEEQRIAGAHASEVATMRLEELRLTHELQQLRAEVTHAQEATARHLAMQQDELLRKQEDIRAELATKEAELKRDIGHFNAEVARTRSQFSGRKTKADLKREDRKVTVYEHKYLIVGILLALCVIIVLVWILASSV